MAHFKRVVWAIIFLTKLRLPPGISIALCIFQKMANPGRSWPIRVGGRGAPFEFLTRQFQFPNTFGGTKQKPNQIACLFVNFEKQR